MTLPTDFWAQVSAIGTALGAIATAAAIWASVKVHQRQSSLTKAIHEQQVNLTRTIHNETMLRSSRELLFPLWDHLVAIQDVDPAKPIGPDMIRMANTLELVGLCWEGQLIDPNLVRRTFQDRFIYFYEKLRGCTRPPAGFKTGSEYLQETRAASKLYAELKKASVERDALKPIQGGEP